MAWWWLQGWRFRASPRAGISGAACRFFLQLDRVGRHILAGEDEVALVGDDPLDGLALGELHGLGDRGGEVDVILCAVFAADELDFGWVSHGGAYLVT